VKRVLISSAFRSTLRNHLAEHPRSSGAGSSSADWLDRHAPIRFPSDTVAGRVPDFVFAFHDGEEIGLRMLARIAKRTELAPSDL